jgi:hypothetical protein
MQTASDRLKYELQDALHKVHAGLDRVEILAAALGAFNKPVPEYEPRFRHLVRSGRERAGYEIDTPTRGKR